MERIILHSKEEIKERALLIRKQMKKELEVEIAYPTKIVFFGANEREDFGLSYKDKENSTEFILHIGEWYQYAPLSLIDEILFHEFIHAIVGMGGTYEDGGHNKKFMAFKAKIENIFNVVVPLYNNDKDRTKHEAFRKSVDGYSHIFQCSYCKREFPYALSSHPDVIMVISGHKVLCPVCQTGFLVSDVPVINIHHSRF